MKKLFTILVSLLVTASVYSQTYNVNTFYAELGGYVIKTDGTHGVVVAMQDQADAADWWDAKIAVNDASKHDANGAKFNDWRLPTLRELNLMYLVYNNGNGANLNATYYWSSSEYDNNIAWSQGFNNGEEYDSEKISQGVVRAVRAF